jgi:DNA-binding NarL/FixJ family response regulator
MKKIRVLIADNQALIREGIKSLLGVHPDFEVVGEVEAGTELLGYISRTQPDVIILDYALPGYFCIEDVCTVYANYPHANILVVSSNQNKTDILKALECGVNNYILKLCDKEEFMCALKATARKERFFCGKVVDAILDKQLAKPASCEGISLSPREIEIVQLISEGLTNGDIADKLFLSIHTISTHRKNILRKLDLNKSSELIMYAIKNGLVSAENGTR